MKAQIIAALLFLVLGIVFACGKGTFLIAGYAPGGEKGTV